MTTGRINQITIFASSCAESTEIWHRGPTSKPTGTRHPAPLFADEKNKNSSTGEEPS